jgi:hypothetical protein
MDFLVTGRHAKANAQAERDSGTSANEWEQPDDRRGDERSTNTSDDRRKRASRGVDVA